MQVVAKDLTTGAAKTNPATKIANVGRVLSMKSHVSASCLASAAHYQVPNPKSQILF